MKAEFVETFIDAITDVFSTMIGLDISPEKMIAKDNHFALGEVSGIIAMTSNQIRGSFSISLQASVVFECTERLFGEKSEQLDSETADLVGELTNMVAGVAKATLETKGYDFGMATPNMLLGESHILNHQTESRSVVVIPFTCDVGMVYLEIGLDD